MEFKSEHKHINNFYREAGGHSPSAPLYNQDSYFTWRGKNSWLDFGCFIINNGDELHWLGLNFSNDYYSPMYNVQESSLSGLKFEVPEMSFKVGVYGTTLSEYRLFLNWLSPAVIDSLSFGYMVDYYYKVKLSEVTEGVRHIIGYDQNEALYYVELTISFELQGEHCAWKNYLTPWKIIDTGTEEFFVRSFDTDIVLPPVFDEDIQNTDIISDLRNGIQIYFSNLEIRPGDNIEVIAEPITKHINSDGETTYEFETSQEIVLFKIGFYTDPESNSNINYLPLSFIYDSTTGIIYNSNESEIFTLKTTNMEGVYIINSLIVNKFLLPSIFHDKVFYTNSQNQNNIIRDVCLKIKKNNVTFTGSDTGTIVIKCRNKTIAI